MTRQPFVYEIIAAVGFAASQLAGLAQTGDPADPPSSPRAPSPPTTEADEPLEAPQPIDRPAATDSQRAADEQAQADAPLADFLAAKLMLANEAEVELALVALDESQDQQVRRLAESIVEDHRQLNTRLEQKMPAVARMIDRQERAASRRADAAAEPGPAGSEGRSAAAQADSAAEDRPLEGAARQLLAIAEQACENRTRMAKQALAKYDGQDFEMAFLGMQIASHMAMLAELEAVGQLGPPECRQVVEQARQMTEQHLDTARQLSQRLEDDRRTAPIGTRPSGQPPR